jgi:hypothetical protein
VYHKTVEELWYFLSGEGEVWRKHTDKGRGRSCESWCKRGLFPLVQHFNSETPVGAAVFRNSDHAPTPGEDEAVPTDGKWKVTSG